MYKFVLVCTVCSFSSVYADTPKSQTLANAVSNVADKVIGLSLLVEGQIDKLAQAERSHEDLAARHDVLSNEFVKLKRASANLAALRKNIREVSELTGNNANAITEFRTTLSGVTEKLTIALKAIEAIQNGELSEAFQTKLVGMIDSRITDSLTSVNERLLALENRVNILEMRVVRWRPSVSLLVSAPTPVFAQFANVSVSVDVPFDAYFVFSGGIGYTGMYEDLYTIGLTGSAALLWRLLTSEFALGPSFRYLSANAFENIDGDDFSTTYQSFNGGLVFEWTFVPSINNFSSVLGLEFYGGGSALLGDKKWIGTFTSLVTYSYQF